MDAVWWGKESTQLNSLLNFGLGQNHTPQKNPRKRCNFPCHCAQKPYKPALRIGFTTCLLKITLLKTYVIKFFIAYLPNYIKVCEERNIAEHFFS